VRDNRRCDRLQFSRRRRGPLWRPALHGWGVVTLAVTTILQPRRDSRLAGVFRFCLVAVMDRTEIASGPRAAR
jgi:hypothetical protein